MNYWTLAFFSCHTLVDTESVGRLAAHRSISPPPDRPSPRGFGQVRHDGDAPRRRPHASVPQLEHSASAMAKTPRLQPPARTTLPSLHTTAPANRPSPQAVCPRSCPRQWASAFERSAGLAVLRTTDRCTEPPAGVEPDGAAACAGHRRQTAAWGGALGACAPGRSAAARLSRSAVRADPAAAGALGAPASASGHRAWAET